MHTCACFMHIHGCCHRICCLTCPHTSIHREGGASRRLHKKRRLPFVESFMDGCVWAGEAADAMETSINIHETCACMHITRNSCGYDIGYLFIPGLFWLIQDYSGFIQAYPGLFKLIPGLFRAYSSLFQAYSSLFRVYSGLIPSLFMSIQVISSSSQLIYG